MYESSGSQLFRTTTEIQSGPDAFYESGFAMTFFAEDNTSGPLNRGGITDSPLLRTLLAIRQKFREPSFWEVMDSFVLVAYASLAASRTLLQRLLACLNFTLDSEDFYQKILYDFISL